MIHRLALRILNEFRRGYLFRFRKSYVKKQLQTRKGNCIRCGTCCLHPWGKSCKHLDSTISCTIYSNRTCLNPFPIDELEQRLHGVKGKCGYYWD